MMRTLPLNMRRYLLSGTLVRRLIMVVMGIAGLTACNTSLTEDQRKALREEMDKREIRKISEHEIFRQALAMGKSMAEKIESDSAYQWKKEDETSIKVLTMTDSTGLTPTELKIWSAYAYAPERSAPDDNIQKDGDEFFIYSKPVGRDSSRALLLIRIAKKKVVLSL
ncbi:hypothetical protein FNH22_04885 [Fulvivirga sp. M361]|uniref:hypothetical protein n=1 Tax=Fulvivirga sp. M361 TaxID=2594266 RepID=UPI0011798EEF|nr:hypothetical protein [Fulvivirga sp. M361]TRX61394.1 hypothetical protein FNH22_04885 [Fulvivirga sp. M361]